MNFLLVGLGHLKITENACKSPMVELRIFWEFELVKREDAIQGPHCIFAKLFFNSTAYDKFTFLTLKK